MFIVKKLLSAYLDPMPICLTLLVVGLALLWFTTRQRAGKILVTVGGGLILLLSFGLVSELVVSPLEHARPLLVDPHDPRTPRALAAKWIVILGGGHVAAPGLPPTIQLGPNTLARLVEGIRLKRQIPGAKLILSGAFGPGPSHAQVVAAAAQLLGVNREDLVLENTTWDTVDEARFIGARLGHDPFILISDASHLPRATRLFRKQGLDPLPSPAGYASLDAPGVALGSFFPSAGPVQAVERATHEYVGILFGWLRGQI
jgi:uncharacterized SAM-binding protein YcdF (DUF218 family)